MLSLIEENYSPQIYQVSSSKGVSQQKVFPSNPGQLDACKNNMFPTNMVVPGSQMAASKVNKAQSKAAAMETEITKTYARKGKAPNGQQVKPIAPNDT